jgi:transcriptional regulator, LysR family
MRLTLDTLAILDAIARWGSFARAAQALDRAPSSLSYAIQQLEADLDVLLFDRSGHRARLTPAGQVLLDDGRVLLQAAASAEQRVRQAADGWEAQLTLALDAVLPVAPVLACVAEFDALGQKTAIRIRSEVLAGAWDALLGGDADLAIGASGEGPGGGGLRTRKLGRLEFAFCVAPTHPLAAIPTPLIHAEIEAYRAVVLADTARNLPLRSVGVLQQQARLAVPDMAAKLAAQQQGLGVGHLPRWLLASTPHGLIEKPLAQPIAADTLQLAWRSGESGRALAWFVQRLSQADAFAGVLDV